MPAIRVNGGIINNQTLTGSLRYFKMVGPFGWTKSDGTVNLNVWTAGGTAEPPVKTYFRVGNGSPVPGSAAELALQEISKQCDITIITLVPFAADADDTTAIHFACSASAFGWGSNVPDYNTPPANQPEDSTAAAPQMQAVVNALGVITVPIGGTANQSATPLTADVDMATVTVTEVPFVLA